MEAAAGTRKSRWVKSFYKGRIYALKKEENAMRKALKIYQYGLHALEIEELTIKYQMDKMRTFDSDLQNSVIPDIGDIHTSSVNDGHLNAERGPDTNIQDINQRPLNLEATHLIQRMLCDSVAYEEEEEEEEESDR